MILVVTGLMTHAAQERARDAAKRADVRIADAESKATRAVEQAQAMLDAPVSLEVEIQGWGIRSWQVKVPSTLETEQGRISISWQESQ